jgi:hypothetical protein
VDVQLAQPTTRSMMEDSVLVEGRMTLLDRDEYGLFYRMSKARLVTG